ncbi:hypothetical protein BGW41_004582 [Actinomortierella wolfii]|nr:hypothetical protein BGW41_004582 [Actinomortierella wolfii]
MNRIGLRTPVQSTCTSNRLPLKSVSTRFTSTSAPRSSATATATTSASANATATTTTATTAVTSAAKTLSHHEEMTKVKFSYNWWKEWTIIMTVFAITGSSSVYFVKPILKNVLKLEGSMQEGPWSYRLTYVCTTMPTYSITLLAVASLFGRRPYFQKVVLRMWSRFLPKKVLQRFQ